MPRLHRPKDPAEGFCLAAIRGPEIARKRRGCEWAIAAHRRKLLYFAENPEFAGHLHQGALQQLAAELRKKLKPGFYEAAFRAIAKHDPAVEMRIYPPLREPLLG